MENITEAQIQRLLSETMRKPPAKTVRRPRVTLRRLEARLLDADGPETIEDVLEFIRTGRG